MKRAWPWVALLLGLLALVVGFTVAEEGFSYAYYVSLLFWLTLAVGTLLWIIMGELTGASWLGELRPLATVLPSTLAVLALLALPLAWHLEALFPWRRGALPPHLHGYFSLPAFATRSAIYWASWIVPAELLVRWRGDGFGARRRITAAVAVVLISLTISGASFDWLMSLVTHWTSTILGLYVGAGALLSGIAGLVIGAALAAPRYGITPRHFHALGRVALALVVFWAYLGFAQFFIIYMGDLPDEVGWFTKRLALEWRGLTLFLALGHFAAPLLLLLPRRPKKSPLYLASLCAWLLLAHYADIYWLVVPSALPAPVFGISWVVSLVGTSAVVVGFAALRIRHQNLLAPPGAPAAEPVAAHA